MQLNKKNLFLLLALFCCSHALPQNNGWSKASGWKLYQIQGNSAFKCTADSLKNLQNVLLDPDSLNYFLKAASAWPDDNYPLWMGSYLISYADLKGGMHKIDISMYGSFFYDEGMGMGKYFQVPAHLKKGWLAFIRGYYEKLSAP